MNAAKTMLPAAVLGSALLVVLADPAEAQMSLPSDVKPTCSVPEDTFKSWFRNWGDSGDARVLPADSVGFPTDNTVCDFYKWGAQMFLWLTSPEGKGLVLDGADIFAVSPPNDKGKRHLIPNDDGGPMNFAVRGEKPTDIGAIAQAGGGGVLMSQTGSLVYYGVHANDIYGYFLTGQQDGPLSGATRFPRNRADLDAVEDYVKKAFPDVELGSADALTMEMKTSWVDASTVDQPDDYIQIEAVVPAYDTGSETRWTRNGTRTTTLALTGIHVVGTVQNHPEMVWATFEHLSNVPDVAYWYETSDGDTVQQPYSSDGDFLFMETGGSPDAANIECMKLDGKTGDIVATTKNGDPACKGGIVSSDTVRSHPWGSKPDRKSAENNTLLLSNNISVQSQLTKRDATDVRANYIQVGGIWTSAPRATADAPIPDMEGFQDSDFRGSLTLANSTMETYHQDISCFVCHSLSQGTPTSAPAFGISHIYHDIAPISKK